MGHRYGWLVTLPLLLAGCGSAAAGHAAAGSLASATSSPATPTGHASTVATTAPTPLLDCGAVPVSDSASRAAVGVTATMAARATAGSTLQVQVHLRSLDGQQHRVETGHPSVLITLHGKVVGEYEGPGDAVAVQAAVPAAGDTTLPGSGLLAGCPATPVDPAAPELTRKSLPAGSYDVVVMLDDVTTKPFGVLVSAPVPLAVTADPEALPTCGDVPVSTDPPQSRIAGVLTGPAEAKGGATVQVQVQLRSNLGRPEQLESSLPIDLLVVRNGSVVGRSDAAKAGVALGLTVPATGEVPMLDPNNPALQDFRDVTLSGCPQPTSGRHALPPGTYELVGVLDDGSGVLVTQPLPMRVT